MREVEKANYTHNGQYYGVPCYVKFDNGILELAGKNKITDFLINEVLIYLELIVNYLCVTLNSLFFLDIPIGFRVRLMGRINDLSKAD